MKEKLIEGFLNLKEIRVGEYYELFQFTTDLSGEVKSSESIYGLVMSIEKTSLEFLDESTSSIVTLDYAWGFYSLVRTDTSITYLGIKEPEESIKFSSPELVNKFSELIESLIKANHPEITYEGLSDISEDADEICGIEFTMSFSHCGIIWSYNLHGGSYVLTLMELNFERYDLINFKKLGECMHATTIILKHNNLLNNDL